MSTIRGFLATDILRYNNVNLDRYTETFYPFYYNSYLSQWPDLCMVTQSAHGTVSGYMLAKVEGQDEEWHGHVSAVTVAPSYRRTGLASLLMDELERVCDAFYKTNYVDLYVRSSNFLAVSLYKQLGYIVARRVLNYYNGDEDAYDMRKACKVLLSKGRDIVPEAKPTKPTSYDTG